MLFMLWASAGPGHRQAHGTKTVPWLPAFPCGFVTHPTVPGGSGSIFLVSPYRYPAGRGGPAILRTIAPNSRRVR